MFDIQIILFSCIWISLLSYNDAYFNYTGLQITKIFGLHQKNNPRILIPIPSVTIIQKVEFLRLTGQRFINLTALHVVSGSHF